MRCVSSVFSVSLWLIPSLYGQDAGAKLFNPVCSNGYCHGVDAKGGGGPSLRTKKYTHEFLTRVITDGVSGTAMRGFKDEYNKDQIQELVKYILSFQGEARAETSSKSGDSVGDPGREVFQNHCVACHALRGSGGKVAQDLELFASDSAQALLKRITSPPAKSDSAYALISVVTKDGRKITGVKRRETEESLQVYDLSSLPPVSRSVAKEDIDHVESTGRSGMPSDFGKRLTEKQLTDLMNYLKHP